MLQTNITGECGEHLQCSGHTGFAPASGRHVCFPHLQCSGSRLLCKERALCGQAVLVFGSSTKAQTWLGLRLVPSLARAAQAARSLTSELSLGVVHLILFTVPASVSTCTGRVSLVSVLGSWPLAVTLQADVNHPESQDVFGQKLEACLQFGRGCHL